MVSDISNRLESQEPKLLNVHLLTRWLRFALNNINLTLARLIWNFDMKLGDGARDWATDQKIFNDWQLPELPVLLEPRGNRPIPLR